MSRDRKQRFWDGERFRFPEYYEIETNRYFDTFRDLENNTPIKNLVVSDFTGLSDKNGKEIYEGDVLATGTHFKCPVTFADGCFQLKSNEQQGNSHLTQGRAERLNIIGNIHENPELLK